MLLRQILCVSFLTTLYKVCHGHTTLHIDHYAKLKKTLEGKNCSIIIGNLIIFNIEEHQDLSFLSSIEEITGYLQVFQVVQASLPLYNLRLVRGKELTFHGNSIYYVYNYRKTPAGYVGLRDAGLHSLTEVSRGNVVFDDSPFLCNVEKTILWKDIISPGSNFTFISNVSNSHFACNVTCPRECNGFCWNSHTCQRLTKEICHSDCDRHRCFGPSAKECCDKSCAGGCFGVTAKQCYACSKLSNDEECVEQCPLLTVFNPISLQFERNPRGRYFYKSRCVEKCPPFLVIYKGGCLKKCPSGRTEIDQHCVRCNGVCPKICTIKRSEYVKPSNIQDYTNCTVISGSLLIIKSSFLQEFMSNGTVIPPLSVQDFKVLQSIKTITGALAVQDAPNSLMAFNLLPNLENIYGRELFFNAFSLSIYNNSFKYLYLERLRKIHNGQIQISSNPNLCLNIRSWNHFGNKTSPVPFVKYNALEKDCPKCHPECVPSLGCWAPSSSSCLSCRHYIFQKSCVPQCSFIPNSYANASSKICLKCHAQCSGGCFGPKSNQCHSCKTHKNGNHCVSQCVNKWSDERGNCKACHRNCHNSQCTGPKDTLGSSGCKFCMFLEEIKENEYICRLCDPLCTGCTGAGIRNCLTCRYYSYQGTCVKSCPINTYSQQRNNISYCLPCSNECAGNCTGPKNDQCFSCKNFQLRHNNTYFYCLLQCPKHTHIATENKSSIQYCVERKNSSIVLLSVSLTFLLFFLLVSFKCVYSFYSKRRKIQLSNEFYLQMMGEDSMLPSDCIVAQPQLNIIPLNELERGKLLGEGAFSSVYLGVWNQKKLNKQIPVAIKILRGENIAERSREIIDEATILCRLDHPNLLKLLAINVSKKVFIITELIPLGSLQQFVRLYSKLMSSDTFWLWSLQISEGMEYLESQHVIHRDLAARNVLVHTLTQVKISDFGCAKSLNNDEDIYSSSGGKMPFKWLAIECFESQIFSTASDVWAYGITLWEMYSLGQTPYAALSAKEMLPFLKSGSRLLQPSLVSASVYATLLHCWCEDPRSRPTFESITHFFTLIEGQIPSHFFAKPIQNILLESKDCEDGISQEKSSRKLSNQYCNTHYPTSYKDACGFNSHLKDTPSTSSQEYMQPLRTTNQLDAETRSKGVSASDIFSTFENEEYLYTHNPNDKSSKAKRRPIVLSSSSSTKEEFRETIV